MNSRTILETCARKLVGCCPDSKLRTWRVLAFDTAGVALTLSEPRIELFEFEHWLPPESAIKSINENANLQRWQERIFVGNVCVVAHMDEVPVFYLWFYKNTSRHRVHLNRVTDMKVDVMIPSGTVYFWDAWTNEKFRGKGIHGFVTRRLCKDLHSKGMATTIALVDSLNSSSIRSFQKCGFTAIHTVRHLRVYGVEILNGKWTL